MGTSFHPFGGGGARFAIRRFLVVGEVCAGPGDPLPGQLKDTITGQDHRGLVPPGWLLLRGMNDTEAQPFFYPVPVHAVIGRIICRLRH